MASNAQSIIEAAFPTWILRADRQLPDASLNEVVQLAYDTQSRDRTGSSWSLGNYGLGYTSYESRVDLCASPVIAALAAFFLEQANNYARHISVDLRVVSLKLGRLWANINPKHSYHGEHMHSDAFVSGVYYIQTPARSGNTLFRDPRPATAFCRPQLAASTPSNASSITVKPRPGLLIVFPGWLMHSVEQNQSDEDRISLSFNVRLVDRSDAIDGSGSKNV